MGGDNALKRKRPLIFSHVEVPLLPRYRPRPFRLPTITASPSASAPRQQEYRIVKRRLFWEGDVSYEIVPVREGEREDRQPLCIPVDRILEFVSEKELNDFENDVSRQEFLQEQEAENKLAARRVNRWLRASGLAEEHDTTGKLVDNRKQSTSVNGRKRRKMEYDRRRTPDVRQVDGRVDVFSGVIIDDISADEQAIATTSPQLGRSKSSETPKKVLGTIIGAETEYWNGYVVE